jgi:aspartate kinase
MRHKHIRLNYLIQIPKIENPKMKGNSITNMQNNVIVAKFGGSSLADALQFEKVKSIITADTNRKFIIPSAPGKRFKQDTKITDMLIDCYNGKDLFGAIKERYDEIIEDLELDISLSEEYCEIEKHIKTNPEYNYIISRGEYLNGIILAAYLGFEFVDSAEVIKFNDNGTYNSELTSKLLRKKLKTNSVIPGFYGSDNNGNIKTFSRSGSDVTGAIVAGAVRAKVYENWTDVPGVMVADPRVVDSPKVIKTITYRELRELAYMGANVLHEDAIFPVRSAMIPINIKDTNNPELAGTMIIPSESLSGDDEDIPSSEYLITGIAGKRGFRTLNIEKHMLNSEIGFCRKLLSVFENNGISIEHMPTGIDTVSVIYEDKFDHETNYKLMNEISIAVKPSRMSYEGNLALLAIVGRNMRNTRGIAAKIFAALEDAGINIKMLDQGSSEINIIISVLEKDLDTAIRMIYKKFIK